ncbi:MAG: thioesterase family protein [Ferruginibacter sp.]
MARVKLQMPGNSIAEIAIPVRITDINYGNHLGNDALVSILHEARVQWLASMDYSELNLAGTSLIMSDLAVEYKNEGFYGDMLTVKIAMGEISSSGFEVYYHILNQQQKEIARAKTGLVCFNYETRKIAPVPEAFLQKVQAL